MKRVVRLPLLFCVATGASIGLGLAAGPEEIVLTRQHPLAATWGEVTVIESVRITAAPRGKEIPYAHGLGLNFTGRSRTDDAERLREGAPQPRSEAEPIGSIFVVANFDDDQRGWPAFRGRLLAAIARLSPTGYGPFLDGFSKQVMAAATPDIPYSVVYCVTTPGAGEHSAEVTGQATSNPSGGRGWRSTSTNLGDLKGLCPPLRAALEFGTPAQVITTDLQVTQFVAESLALNYSDRTGNAAAPWPEAAGGKRDAAPEAPTDAAIPADAGGADPDDVRQPRESETGGEPPRDSFAAAGPTDLSKEFLASRSLVARWTWTAHGEQVGPAPRTLFDDSDDLLSGVFLTAKASGVNLPGLRDAMAEKLQDVNGVIDARAVKDALVDCNATLGVDEALLVLCYMDLRHDQKADYCIGRSCSQVTNPEETCSALRAHLGD